jgi:hypothetical protein
MRRILALPSQASLLLTGLAVVLYWSDHDVSLTVPAIGIFMIALAVRSFARAWWR